MTDKQFTIDELATMANLPVRTVRFYIQQGLVDRPLGLGRGAQYSQHHLEQLVEVRTWTQAGLSLERIAHLRTNPPPTIPEDRTGTIEVWSHVILADGVEVHINAGRAGLTPEHVRELVKRVQQEFHNITKEPS